MGVNPARAYAALVQGAVGNRNSLAETLLRAVPLALAGVGVAIAFRAGVFNVGAEGQLFVGAMASPGSVLPSLVPSARGPPGGMGLSADAGGRNLGGDCRES